MTVPERPLNHWTRIPASRIATSARSAEWAYRVHWWGTRGASTANRFGQGFGAKVGFLTGNTTDGKRTSDFSDPIWDLREMVPNGVYPQRKVAQKQDQVAGAGFTSGTLIDWNNTIRPSGGTDAQMELIDHNGHMRDLWSVSTPYDHAVSGQPYLVGSEYQISGMPPTMDDATYQLVKDQRIDGADTKNNQNYLAGYRPYYDTDLWMASGAITWVKHPDGTPAVIDTYMGNGEQDICSPLSQGITTPAEMAAAMAEPDQEANGVIHHVLRCTHYNPMKGDYPNEPIKHGYPIAPPSYLDPDDPAIGRVPAPGLPGYGLSGLPCGFHEPTTNAAELNGTANIVKLVPKGLRFVCTKTEAQLQAWANLDRPQFGWAFRKGFPNGAGFPVVAASDTFDYDAYADVRKMALILARTMCRYGVCFVEGGPGASVQADGSDPQAWLDLAFGLNGQVLTWIIQGVFGGPETYRVLEWPKGVVNIGGTPTVTQRSGHTGNIYYDLIDDPDPPDPTVPAWESLYTEANYPTAWTGGSVTAVAVKSTFVWSQGMTRTNVLAQPTALVASGSVTSRTNTAGVADAADVATTTVLNAGAANRIVLYSTTVDQTIAILTLATPVTVGLYDTVAFAWNNGTNKVFNETAGVAGVPTITATPPVLTPAFYRVNANTGDLVKVTSTLVVDADFNGTANYFTPGTTGAPPPIFGWFEHPNDAAAETAMSASVAFTYPVAAYANYRYRDDTEEWYGFPNDGVDTTSTSEGTTIAPAGATLVSVYTQGGDGGRPITAEVNIGGRCQIVFDIVPGDEFNYQRGANGGTGATTTPGVPDGGDAGAGAWGGGGSTWVNFNDDPLVRLGGGGGFGSVGTTSPGVPAVDAARSSGGDGTSGNGGGGGGWPGGAAGTGNGTGEGGRSIYNPPAGRFVYVDEFHQAVHANSGQLNKVLIEFMTPLDVYVPPEPEPEPVITSTVVFDQNAVFVGEEWTASGAMTVEEAAVDAILTVTQRDQSLGVSVALSIGTSGDIISGGDPDDDIDDSTNAGDPDDDIDDVYSGGGPVLTTSVTLNVPPQGGVADIGSWPVGTYDVMMSGSADEPPVLGARLTIAVTTDE